MSQGSMKERFENELAHLIQDSLYADGREGTIGRDAYEARKDKAWNFLLSETDKARAEERLRAVEIISDIYVKCANIDTLDKLQEAQRAILKP